MRERGVAGVAGVDAFGLTGLRAARVTGAAGARRAGIMLLTFWATAIQGAACRESRVTV